MQQAHDAPGFTRERLDRIEALEDWHFWFVPRRELIERHLADLFPRGSRVAEIGAGTGALLVKLASRGVECAGVDLHPCRKELPDGVRWYVGDAAALPLDNGSQDGVVMLDLLEHVDEASVLAEAFRVLRPGGTLLLSVPAFPVLWSYRDRAAGHQRRYTPKTLRLALERAGFVLSRTHGYQVLLLPILIASRVLARNSEAQRDREETPPQWLNRALTWLNRVDARLAVRLQIPWGSSLFVIAKKPRV